MKLGVKIPWDTRVPCTYCTGHTFKLGVKIPRDTRVPRTYCMGHTFKFKLGVKIPWDTRVPCTYCMSNTFKLGVKIPRDTRVPCTYCMSNTFKLGVKIPRDTRVPWPIEWATSLLLNNTIMLRITGANKSLCEVKGGDTNWTVAPFPMLLHSLMVNTPDSHASQRGFKSQWHTFSKTLPTSGSCVRRRMTVLNSLKFSNSNSWNLLFKGKFNFDTGSLTDSGFISPKIHIKVTR